MINETLARVMFSDESPLGRRIGNEHRWIEIVGVVGAKRHRDLAQDPLTEIYVPRRQERSGRTMWVVARTSDSPALLLPQLRTALRELDESVAFANAAVLSDRVALSIAPQRFRSILLGTLLAWPCCSPASASGRFPPTE